ncbi:MAG: aminoacetone oxidase family FAD-binding enzyme [Eubacterium sp.]|nr:aminoacetone oxidase family FAD-binding enzyme [Eubacterium sp.]
MDYPEKEIVIIGGGASGLMAAAAAASENASVTVLEYNEKPGKKLLASGNGRCNLTNLKLDTSAYHSDHPERAERVLNRFSVQNTLRFFKTLGLRTFDRGGWVYPSTEQASQVRDLLLWECERLGVRFKTHEEVISLRQDPSGSGYLIHTKGWKYRTGSVIIACGSMASSVRGSSDTAVRLADTMGIPRHPFLPILVPLRIKEKVYTSMNGTRVHAALKLLVDRRQEAEEEGELQMTSYGVSGIPVFQLSRIAVPALNQDSEVILLIDFLPDISGSELKEEWNMREANAPEKTNFQLLTGIIPEKVIPVVLHAAGLRPHEVPHLTDHAVGGPTDRLLALLKQFPVTITGTAPFEQAQVCTGGIALSSLTDSLMVRKYPGLYAAGEAVHVDGPCGGYNLQWAWSSGYVAGCAAALGETE